MSEILSEMAPERASDLVIRTKAEPAGDPFRPSEYTALLIQMLRADPTLVRDADALEIGCGSGAVLAALGAMGARSLCGIDVEDTAVTAAAALLRGLGFSGTTTLLQGDMWQPVTGRRFSLIVANLPHLPCSSALPGRLESWSCGGPDGRQLLDRFLRGLGAHLTEDGRAVITHNGFVDVELSRTMLAESGLRLNLSMTTLVYLPREKMARLTPSILARHAGGSIHRFGDHAFAEMHIAEIRAAPAK